MSFWGVGDLGDSGVLQPNKVNFGAQLAHCRERIVSLKENKLDDARKRFLVHEENREKILVALIAKFGEKPVEDDTITVKTKEMWTQEDRYDKERVLRKILSPVTNEVLYYISLDGRQYQQRNGKWCYVASHVPYVHRRQ
jgi:hypothetical protein